MAPETIQFGLASAAVVLMTAAALPRQCDSIVCASLLLITWALGAALEGRIEGLLDYLFPGIALVTGLYVVGLFEKRWALWKLALALSYVVELAAYYRYGAHQTDGWIAIHDCETVLGATFKVQLCIIASEPGRHALAGIYRRLRRRRAVPVLPVRAGRVRGDAALP